ncbi:prolactin-releasing peptide receptor-like [Diachasmimorpha longicaudata]|uniref:prolactin-releasing peptide receptor-like n=1 Tax=Diachasmimorpha longicaudata TaxID=58733 RepID=UPI0030B8DF84
MTPEVLENETSFLNGSTENIVDDYLTTNIWVQGIFYLLYAAIFLIGVFGNALVCYVVARNTQMQTVTNLFITNLALSDVLLCVLAVPFTPLYTFLGRWVFGQTLCHLVPYAQGVSIYISTFTLTSIAVDRFLVIIYPFRPRMKIKICVWVILGIWAFALLLTLPYGLYMTLEEPFTYCEEHWPSVRLRKLFSSFTSILQFVVPFFVIAFCYICVSIKLNHRVRSKPGTKTGKQEEVDRERKKRTNRMLIAMVAIFGVCWLPLNMLNVVDDFYADTNHWMYYRLCFFITHWLAMSSTCYNPFLYAWLNDNFRKEFTHVLPFIKPRNTTPRTTEAYKSEKLCNGNDTVQESLLSTLASRSNQTRESIQLESRPVLTPVFHPTELTINEFTGVEDALL